MKHLGTNFATAAFGLYSVGVVCYGVFAIGWLFSSTTVIWISWYLGLFTTLAALLISAVFVITYLIEGIYKACTVHIFPRLEKTHHQHVHS